MMQRTGAIRAPKPAALTAARRKRAIGAVVAGCAASGLVLAGVVQLAGAPAPTAAAVELPSVAELAAAQPQTYQASLVDAASGVRDEQVSLELEPEPTPEPAPAAASSESSSDSGGSSSGSNAPSYPTGGTYTGESPQAIAQNLLASRGMADQWGCFEAIIGQESGWNPYAENPYSGAYGIPQALPGSKMASHGADWATNPATQIAWALDYMNGRYGSPCGAYDFKFTQGNGWY